MLWLVIRFTSTAHSDRAIYRVFHNEFNFKTFIISVPNGSFPHLQSQYASENFDIYFYVFSLSLSTKSAPQHLSEVRHVFVCLLGLTYDLEIAAVDGVCKLPFFLGCQRANIERYNCLCNGSGDKIFHISLMASEQMFCCLGSFLFVRLAPG